MKVLEIAEEWWHVVQILILSKVGYCHGAGVWNQDVSEFDLDFVFFISSRTFAESHDANAGSQNPNLLNPERLALNLHAEKKNNCI